MSDNNGWAGRPGVPLNPERDGWHWVDDGVNGTEPRFWGATFAEWDGYPLWMAKEWDYLRPCSPDDLTPAEMDARIAAAHKEWLAELNHDTDALMEAARQSALAECIAACDAVIRLYRVELPEKYKFKPEGIPFEWEQTWEGWAEIAEDIAAAIRALSDTPSGTYASEAEQERGEFFNRLGRITEELNLPMEATASRIIEAIRERVASEREACASVSVKVVVPEGADAWTPLEAWEEALLVFDEAFRDAIRSRVLSETPPGMVLVPREPTTAMIQACLQAALDFMAETKTTEVHPGQTYPSPSENARRCWRAMVKAAGKGEGNE
jgi:hypothetical protein